MAEKYYKGNNIGLTFDGTGWKLNNLPQNFINPEAFSTKDPVFPKVPTPPTTTEPEKDPCPPGYIFDKALNQCVPDPNYQTDFLGQPQRAQPTGTDSTEAEYIDFKQMSLKEMEDWGKSKGLIDKDGFFTGYRKTPLKGLMQPIAQFGLYSQDNRFIKALREKGAKIYNPNEQDNLVGNLYIPKFSTTPLKKSTPTAQLRGGVYSPKDTEELIKEKEAEAESLAKEQRLLEEARQASQEKKDIQQTIKRAEEIQKRKETIGQTGGPVGMGSPPPNTSPIGGTGQTYQQFKKR